MRARTALVALATGAFAISGHTSARAQVDLTSTTTAAESTTTTAALVATSSLALTVPVTANLSTGIGAGGGPLVATLGTVAVVDSGGIVPRAWTATVSATDFTTGGGASTIPKALVAYASGPAASVTAGATAVPGQPDVSAPTPLQTPVVAFSGTGTTVESTVMWNPTLVITFPPNLVAGEYQGTITHSVA